MSLSLRNAGLYIYMCNHQKNQNLFTAGTILKLPCSKQRLDNVLFGEKGLVTVVIKKDITRIQTGDCQMLKSLNFLFFFFFAEKLTLRRKSESSVRLSQLTHGRRRGPTLAHTYTQWSDWWKNIEGRPS